MHSECEKKILIVDDEPHIIRVLKLKLENGGYTVITAVNGIDGLEKFVSEKPSVVITDVNMPHIDGQQLCQMMKEHKREDLYVIMMTSSVDQALHSWADNADYIHFMEKPLSPRNVLKEVNKFFSRREAFAAGITE